MATLWTSSQVFDFLPSCIPDSVANCNDMSLFLLKKKKTSHPPLFTHRLTFLLVPLTSSSSLCVLQLLMHTAIPPLIFSEFFAFFGVQELIFENVFKKTESENPHVLKTMPLPGFPLEKTKTKEPLDQKKKKDKGTTTVNPHDITFRNKTQEDRYNTLAQRKIVNARYVDESALSASDDVNLMFNNMGWTQFVYMKLPAYEKITLEFLSSIDANVLDGEGKNKSPSGCLTKNTNLI